MSEERTVVENERVVAKVLGWRKDRNHWQRPDGRWRMEPTITPDDMLTWLNGGHGGIDSVEDITPCPTGGWTVVLWRGIEHPSFTGPTLTAAVMAIAERGGS